MRQRFLLLLLSDEVGCIVFDVGTGYTKVFCICLNRALILNRCCIQVGFSGEDAPKACFPTACGTVHGEEDTDMKAAPGESADQEGGAKAPKHKKCFVGDSQKKYRENQETIYPVQNGLGQSSSFAVTSIFYR